MSMGIVVFIRGKLPGKAALTRCFRQLGFPLAFQPGTGALERQDGYLPMRLRGEESGIEFFTARGGELLEAFGEDLGAAIDPCVTQGVYLHWSFSAEEGAVALCFAAALATLANGTIFEEASASMLSVEAAVARGHADLRETTPSSRERGTRPADIRHYLQPLLQKRSDLVLIGRMLVVRPVRHLVRCAFLDRTSDRYMFRLFRSCTPLYAPDGGVDEMLHDGALEVWQPHFEPLLIALLAKDVFEPLGAVATLHDFASQNGGGPPFLFAQVTSLLLAGERDRAAALVADIEGRYEWLAAEIRQHWERVSADIQKTCAECHAKERETVTAMKLDRFWEPSPFPVELPASRRAVADEPLFPVSPWPGAPSWLWQPLPREPGSVCYGRRVLYRGHDIVLLVALTPADAGERHRMRETYVLAARLPDGVLALVSHWSLYDRDQPQDYRREPSHPYIWISLRGEAHIVNTNVFDRDDAAGRCSIVQVEVCDRATSATWYCSLDLKDGTKTIWQSRGGEQTHASSLLTAAERDATVCPIPPFGEYVAPVERVRNLLRVVGFGNVA